jgi:hypothetical protein
MDDQLSDADLMDLNRLVTELAWRVDHRRADAVADLFVDDGEMVLGSAAMRGRGGWRLGQAARQRWLRDPACLHEHALRGVRRRCRDRDDGGDRLPPQRGRPGRHHGVRSGGVPGPPVDDAPVVRDICRRARPRCSSRAVALVTAAGWTMSRSPISLSSIASSRPYPGNPQDPPSCSRAIRYSLASETY